MEIYGGGARPRPSASSALSSSDFHKRPVLPDALGERSAALPACAQGASLVFSRGRLRLWPAFFKSCCLKVPLKVVGSMYTCCLVAGCVIGARLQLLGPSDAVWPAVLSLLSFLLAVCARSLLLAPPSEAVKAASEGSLLGPLSSPRFLLCLLVAGFLHLGAASFALSPLREALQEESRTLLHAFLVLFACATVFLHLYRHVAKSRYQLLLCPSKPGPAPILLVPCARLACVETLAGFLLAVPLFLLLLPVFLVFSSFPTKARFSAPESLASAPLDDASVSTFSVSSALSRPLSFLVSLVFSLSPRPGFALDGICDWSIAILVASLVFFLLLLLFNVHGELQQQARASDCLSVASFIGRLSCPSSLVSRSCCASSSVQNSSFSSCFPPFSSSASASSGNPAARDCAPLSDSAAQLLGFSPPHAGTGFDGQCLLLHWLYDCVEALQSSVAADVPSALPPYVPVRPRASLLSCAPAGSALWGLCPVCERGDLAGAPGAAATALGSTGPWGAETGGCLGGAWQLLALLQDPHSTAQRENCPLVPALAEFFAETSDDFPLLPPHPQASLIRPCDACRTGAGAAKWEEARRSAKKTAASEEGEELFLFSKREAATLAAQQMLETGIFGTPSLLFSLYGNLVRGSAVYFLRLLHDMQQLCVAASRERRGLAGSPFLSACGAAAVASFKKPRDASPLWTKVEPFLPPLVFAFLKRRLGASAVSAEPEGHELARDACGEKQLARERRAAAGDGAVARGMAAVLSLLASIWNRRKSLTSEPGPTGRSSVFNSEETAADARDVWRKAQVECSVLINFFACAVEGFALWLCTVAAVTRRIEQSREGHSGQEMATGASHPHVSVAARDAAAGLVLNSLEVLHQQQLLRRFAASARGASPATSALSPELSAAMDELDRRVRQAVLRMRDHEALRLQALAAGLGPAASLSPLTQTELRKLLSQ
ncbi:putative transmembrane protein [Toxoplasma gondii GAB2-2007-GAL-DOM2]|uniref:Putative transmembrane protein n=3 Tax=Toxoplasma gondii TaxID=5811 RepID=A0A086KA54_TOXGO|nr:putative transmembrane protein [Toxoplasma gondii GAB2-2007-GAL-DOM2]